MLERIDNLPAGIEGWRAHGKVSKADFEDSFEPALERAHREGRRIRLLYQFGPEFAGFTADGAWEDAKLGLRAMSRLEACAVVTDNRWVRESSRLASFLIPCPMEVFANDESDKAVQWLESLPHGAGVSYRLIPEAEVIVVEVSHPLRIEDFDALAVTVDAWLDTHEDLRGIVIHGRKFPGWESFGSFLRHVRFVRDHHRVIRRVALAAESKLASIGPRLADHFVHAELKGFAYDDLESAIEWAAGPEYGMPMRPLEHVGSAAEPVQ